MADVKVASERSLSRTELAELLSALASSLASGGSVELDLGGGNTVSFEVPEDVTSEVEVEVDGDEVEVELELSWSTSKAAAPGGEAD